MIKALKNALAVERLLLENANLEANICVPQSTYNWQTKKKTLNKNTLLQEQKLKLNFDPM